MSTQTYHLTTPLKKEDLIQLKAGDLVYLSGVIYSGRDSAHKRIVEAIEKNENLPFELEGQVIYYMGPAPTPEGMVIGSCGPTTSSRMDKFAPKLYELGLGASIGKGKRADNVIDAMKEHKGIYLLATGGAGALYSKCVKSVEVIAYEELGPEAVRKLVVEQMPLLVANDTFGNELYTKAEVEKALA